MTPGPGGRFAVGTDRPTDELLEVMLPVCPEEGCGNVGKVVGMGSGSVWKCGGRIEMLHPQRRMVMRLFREVGE